MPETRLPYQAYSNDFDTARPPGRPFFNGRTRGHNNLPCNSWEPGQGQNWLEENHSEECKGTHLFWAQSWAQSWAHKSVSQVALLIVQNPGYPLLPWSMKGYSENGRLTSYYSTKELQLPAKQDKNESWKSIWPPWISLEKSLQTQWE